MATSSDTVSMATSSDSSVSSTKLSLPEAVKEKYKDYATQCRNGVHIAVPGCKSASSSEHFVPECLTLNDSCINCAGDAGEISELCSGVKELDLTQNKLEDWKEVFSIVSQLPHLHFLNLSYNPLTQPLSEDQLETVSLATITKLVLNNTDVTLRAVYTLLSAMPKLEEVHLSLNKYKTVDVCETTHNNVKLLQFNSNGLTDFQEICKLGKVFPNLEYLYLVENDLKHFSGDIPGSFPCLKCLSLSNNDIENWEELDKLNLFPMLSEVRLKGIPFLEDYPENERRPLVIARLPGVVRLNGSRITETERHDAERMFIRYYMDKVPAEQPQRYQDLLQVYGRLDPLVEVDLSPENAVTCMVKFEDKQKLITVDTSDTLLELKKGLKSFVGMSPAKFKIFLYDRELNTDTDYGLQEMSLLKQKLHTYKVKDGDEFHIF